MDPLLILFLGMIVVVGGILLFRLHAFLALILGALLVGALTPRSNVETAVISLKKQERQKQNRTFDEDTDRKDAIAFSKKTLGERLSIGFGNTCTKIGILIALASIIGQCLLASGAADRIVRSLLRLLGEARAALSFTLSSFLLGIPVFFDTVFYLMIPLGKAMRLRTGKNYLLYILAITAGGSMAHSLVPPTPGPLVVAEGLKVDLGTMILAGCAVCLFTSTAGLLFAFWINRRLDIPVRDVADTTIAEVEESKLPPLWLSLLPVLLPVMLIGGATIIKTAIGKPTPADYKPLIYWVNTFGNKNIALAISAAIALFMLIKQKKTTKEETHAAVSQALASAGVIILITSAGGAFGALLQQTNISERIKELTQSDSLGLLMLPLAFGICTLIRTAQGSSTVAMVTTVAIIAGMVSPSTDLGYHHVYLALAIGAGSKPIAWMNDSGFWVISKMSGMTEAETLKTVTPMSIIMGTTGLAVVMAGAMWVPLTS